MQVDAKPALEHEALLWAAGYSRIAGVDEAGRGCLAGPVVAAAVILPQHVTIEGVDDSKKLTAATREDLYERIHKVAVSIGVGICWPEEIDRLNILWAAMEAMRKAVAALTPGPDYLLIDGHTCFPNSPWPVETIIGGDACCHTIAAASVIAKVTRDRMMHDLHLDFPNYGWLTNVGYPTPAHYAALAQHGPTPLHRRSFRLA
jgi:ribonuclease HII